MITSLSGFPEGTIGMTFSSGLYYKQNPPAFYILSAEGFWVLNAVIKNAWF
jgi:hypothetical protein